jgi:hypothetical protein
MGHFCLICASLYPLHRATHTGRPVYGRDHIASPCTHEGDVFEPGASWWEPGVEVLPAAAAPAAPGTSPAAATAPPPAAAPPPSPPPAAAKP